MKISLAIMYSPSWCYQKNQTHPTFSHLFSQKSLYNYKISPTKAEKYNPMTLFFVMTCMNIRLLDIK